MSGDQLPSWRETPAKHSVTEFVTAVTSPESAGFVPEPERVAVFDNDGTLRAEQPMYVQLAFALNRAAGPGHPASLDELRAGGLPALVELVKLTHSGVTTEEFETLCRRWLASARHPGTGRPCPAMVYQPMPELLGLLDRSGFSCWIFPGGGTDFMRARAGEVYSLPAYRVIGSAVTTEFRAGPGGPGLVETAAIQVINDGPRKPVSIRAHAGQRPVMAAGNTDGDLAMLQWTAASPHRTLRLVGRHNDGNRGYAYDRDPVLGCGTDHLLTAATEHKRIMVDMAADWSAIYPPVPHTGRNQHAR